MFCTKCLKRGNCREETFLEKTELLPTDFDSELSLCRALRHAFMEDLIIGYLLTRDQAGELTQQILQEKQLTPEQIEKFCRGHQKVLPKE